MSHHFHLTQAGPESFVFLLQAILNAEDEGLQDIIERASRNLVHMSSQQKEELVLDMLKKIADAPEMLEKKGLEGGDRMKSAIEIGSKLTSGQQKLGDQCALVSAAADEAPVDNASKPVAPVLTEVLAPPMPTSEPASITGSKADDIERQLYNSVHPELEGDLDNTSATSELDDEKVLFDVRALLNKLTPQNVDKLTQTLLTLGFNENEERLIGSVDLLFEKALDEPHYAETYAKLCRSIIHVEAKSSQPGGPPVKLRTVLLQRIQKCFEQTVSVSEATIGDKEGSRAEVKAAPEKEAQEARRRYLGNLGFVGEIYKVRLLTGNIILHCYQRLQPRFNPDGTLSAEIDELKLESLAVLLINTGKQAEADPQAKDKVPVFFAVLQKLIDMRVTSTRLRVLMQLAIDLRENGYIDAQAVTYILGPKAVKDIHEGEKLAKKVRQNLAEEHVRKKPGKTSVTQDIRHQQPPMAGGDRFSARTSMVKTSTSEARTMAAYSQRGNDSASRISSTKHPAPSKFFGALNRAPAQPTLGPGWITPSGSLGRSGLDNRSAASSRESSLTRGGQAGRRFSTATPTLHQPDSSKPSTPAVRPPAQTVNDDQFHKCIVHMKGVVNAEDEELQDIIERASSQVVRMSSAQKKELIPEIFNKIADSRESDRQRLDQIVPRLTRLGCFDRPDFVEGLGSVIDLTEDLAMDVPQIYQTFIAHIAGPLLIEPGAYHLDIGTLEEILQRAGSGEQIQKYRDALLGWVKSESPAWSAELKETLRKRDAQRWPQYLPSSA